MTLQPSAGAFRPLQSANSRPRLAVGILESTAIKVEVLQAFEFLRHSRPSCGLCRNHFTATGTKHPKSSTAGKYVAADLPGEK